MRLQARVGGDPVDRSGANNGRLQLSDTSPVAPASKTALRPENAEQQPPSGGAGISASILLPQRAAAPPAARPLHAAVAKPVQCGPKPQVPHATSPAAPLSAATVAREERMKQWYKQLLYYRGNPDTLEFSYMVLANPKDVVYRPYDLLVVSHAKVQRDFYYTMSAEGVTHFHGGETSHTSLDEFERAFFLYRQVSEMRFFSRFRLWKAFRLWRACICRRKADVASQYLVKRLFHLHGCFGPCLQALVRTCDSLQKSTAFMLLAAEQPRALDELKARSCLDAMRPPPVPGEACAHPLR